MNNRNSMQIIRKNLIIDKTHLIQDPIINKNNQKLNSANINDYLIIQQNMNNKMSFEISPNKMDKNVID